MIHRFSVGRLNCTVVSDGQPEPPWEPPLDSFFTPESGVPTAELSAAVAAEGSARTTLTGGYNCLLVESPAGLAVIDTGLGARFLGYGPAIGRHVGRLGERLTEAGLSASDLAAVIFTHLHQDHVRGATWPGELAFPAATGHAHAAEIAFWSGDSAEMAAAAAEHLSSARDAIALFGERLRPFEYGAESCQVCARSRPRATPPGTPRCCSSRLASDVEHEHDRQGEVRGDVRRGAAPPRRFIGGA